jgi:Fe-S-cluster containining protein
MPSTGANASSNIRVVFTVNGRPVPVEARVPNRAVRFDELLPALRAMDDRLIDAAVTAAEEAGEHVSCQKGCSACCRTQPVPITPPEAFALARLVDALPEPRQTAVRSAFAAAAEQLRAAELYDLYMRRDPATTRETALAAVRRYMNLALACPFLENDACSIYLDRPFVCRQYLVTSPPDLCAAPLDNPVRPVRAPAAFASAMLKAAETLSGRAQYTVPLVLALDHAAANRGDLERTYAAKTGFSEVMKAVKES